MITRRNLMKTAAAGLTLPALTRSGFAAEPLKVAISQRGFWDSTYIAFAIEQGPDGAGQDGEDGDG